MEQTLNNVKLPLKEKIGYGCGSACDTIPYAMFGTYFLFFLTDVAGLPAGIGGTITFIAILSQIIAGPVAGYLSDNSLNPKGRRRPMMIKGGIVFAIVTALLFTPIGGSMGLKIAYYTILAIAFMVCYGLYFNVWTALGAEMTHDYDERNSIRSVVAYTAIPLELLSTGGVIGIVGFFGARGVTVGKSWLFAAIAMAIFMAAGALICHKSTEETPPVYTEEEKAAVKARRFNAKQLIMDYVSFFKIKVYRRLILFSLIFATGFIMMNDGVVYTMSSYLGLSEARQSLFWTIHTVLSLIAIPIVFGVARKWDKRKAMILFIGSYVVFSLLWFALGMIGTVGFVSYNIFAGVLCLGTVAFYSLLISLLYDCTDVYTLATGEQKEGGMLALQGLAQTMGAAVASLLLGWGLQLFGYTDAASVTEFTKDGIWFMGTAGPAILVIISMIFLVRYKLTRDDFDNVRQAIADRNEGKEIDMSKFKHLI